MILPLVLLCALLAIVAQSWFAGRTFAARIAALAGRATRSRMIAGWAMGIAVTYGASAVVALLALGRGEAVVVMPDEVRATAHGLGLPADPSTIPWTAAMFGIGAVLGIAMLGVRRLLGKPPLGLRFRSAAAARIPAERPAAALLSLAAGVGEELFFRLTLPLLTLIVTGSGAAAFALATLAFALCHRHQGWPGMIATGLVGAWLAYLYLLTGALWFAMLLHTAIDLHALILRPWLAGRANGYAAKRAA